MTDAKRRSAVDRDVESRFTRRGIDARLTRNDLGGRIGTRNERCDGANFCAVPCRLLEDGAFWKSPVLRDLGHRGSASAAVVHRWSRDVNGHVGDARRHSWLDAKRDGDRIRLPIDIDVDGRREIAFGRDRFARLIDGIRVSGGRADPRSCPRTTASGPDRRCFSAYRRAPMARR